MNHGLQLNKVDKKDSPVRHDSYRRLAGQLQYLIGGTRLDLSFSVGYLSLFCSRSSHDHWEAVKRVLRYCVERSEFRLHSAADEQAHPWWGTPMSTGQETKLTENL